ncbi:hypothetical protein BH23PLA1_BH23PLA1_33920 [soil metagenome]
MSIEPKPEGGTTVFVLGLLGILLCAILAPIAWIQGNSYMERARAMGVQPDGLAVAGRIMGMIGTGLLVLGVLLAVLMGVFGALAQ